MANLVFIYITASAWVAYAGYRFITHRSLKHLQGPPSDNFIFGYMLKMSRQWEVGKLDWDNFKKYGTAWRYSLCWEVDSLVVVDPKALQYIFNKSGYNFCKHLESRYVSRQLTGPGLLYAEGDDHARARKIMNPAFTVGQLRTFVPIFSHIAGKLSQKWKDTLQTATSEAEQVINVHRWLSRMALDIVGEAGFDYQCHALDDEENEFTTAYRDTFKDSVFHPTKGTLLFRSLWPYLSDWILSRIEYIPAREYTRMRKSVTIINRIARKLVAEKSEALLAGKENKKDLMSILVKANVSEDPKTRLSEAEMVSQMATFLFAGHESTANTLSWYLYELAKNQDVQDKVRQEIFAIRVKASARGTNELGLSDLDSMQYTVASIKEVLRLYPISPVITRMPVKDDVIPLEYPITSTTGEIISEIPVSKNQRIMASIYVYNRLPQVWGKDSNEFNPDRFLEPGKVNGTAQTQLGVFANLMTFSGGIKGCIGWRFAVMELQAVIAELIENFEFAIPQDQPEIMGLASGITVPVMRGKMHLGVQMPLKVTPIR